VVDIGVVLPVPQDNPVVEDIADTVDYLDAV